MVFVKELDRTVKGPLALSLRTVNPAQAPLVSIFLHSVTPVGANVPDARVQ